jgi:heat shock protein HtpX
MLLAVLTGILVSIGYSYGGKNVAIMALVFAGLMNFGMFWFSDKIVLKMYKARPVGPSDSPRLYNMVERLAQDARMPMPSVYIIPNPSPNAFATGRSPSRAAVAATDGIMKLLNDQELEAVMAHELAHVKNRDTLISTLAATLGGAITFIARMMMFSGGRRGGSRGGGWGALLALILAPIAAMIIQMAVSRRREYMADATGARMCKNPNALASALQRLQSGIAASPMSEDTANPATSHMFIVNPFRGSAMFKLFSTHPPMEERVERLRSMKL